MSIDPIVERLSILKQRLRDAKGEDVRKIAGVDLYPIADPRIKRAWARRVAYYKTLSEDASFLTLEDSAGDTAQRLAKIALSISKKLSPEWARKFSDLFYPPRRYSGWEDEDTLNDKLQYCIDPKNYFSIRQLAENDLAGYPMDNGIYYNCNKIFEQHQLLYQHCQRFGNAARQLANEKEYKQYIEIFHELIGLKDEIELRLIQEPRKLHLGSFERVQLVAAEFDHTVLGHTTKEFQSARTDNEEAKIERIRKAAIDVCEELTLEIAMQPQAQDNASSAHQQKEYIEKHDLKIWPLRQDVECAGKKVTLTGKRWSIVEKCIANEGWVSEWRERGKVNIDSDVQDLNAPWKDTGWKIAMHRDKKIILGRAKRNSSPRKTPETSPKIPRITPVAAH